MRRLVASGLRAHGFHLRHQLNHLFLHCQQLGQRADNTVFAQQCGPHGGVLAGIIEAFLHLRHTAFDHARRLA